MSKIELRDGTVVSYTRKGVEEMWEVKYPNGEETTIRQPIDWKESARILHERFPEEFSEPPSDENS